MNSNVNPNSTTHSSTISGCGCNNPNPEVEKPALFSPQVSALVAIGAAIAANCEPCLRYHANKAKELGVSTVDIDHAVEVAIHVKETPHRNIQKLASQLTQCMSEGTTVPPINTACCSR